VVLLAVLDATGINMSALLAFSVPAAGGGLAAASSRTPRVGGRHLGSRRGTAGTVATVATRATRRRAVRLPLLGRSRR
jgi:hypothetical protein